MTAMDGLGMWPGGHGQDMLDTLTLAASDSEVARENYESCEKIGLERTVDKWQGII